MAAPLPTALPAGLPANVGSIQEYLSGLDWQGPQNNWQAYPSNVLIIPQQIPPQDPILPLPQANTAQYFGSKCCPDETGTVYLVAHDSITGWWFQIATFFGTGCEQDNGDGTCGDANAGGGFNACPVQGRAGDPAISYEEYSRLIMAGLDSDYSGGTPLLDNFDFFDSLPAWAAPPNWSGEVNLDLWTLVCVDTAITVSLSGQTSGITGGGSPSGPHVGFLDPPLPMASDGIGFSAPSNVALPVHPAVTAARIRENCGVCGEGDGVDEDEEEF